MNLFYNRPLLSALTAFIVSTLLGHKLFCSENSALIFLFAFLAFVLAIALWVYKIKTRPNAKDGVVLLCIVLSFAALFSQFVFFRFRLNLKEEFESENTSIIATVNEISYKNNGYTLLNATAKEIGGERANVKLQFELFSENELKSGDIFFCKGSIESVFSLSKDDSNFLFSDSCAGQVTNIQNLSLIGESKNPIFLFSRLREFLSDRIKTNLEDDSGALISALLLGDTSSLNAFIKYDFKRIGITHMLALSGMHLSILMSFIYFLLSHTNLKRSTKNIIITILSLIYIGLSGFCLSIIRAAFMFIFCVISQLTRKDSDPYTSLFAAISVIFIINPASVTDIGLWLSFLGTFGVCVYFEFSKSINKSKKGFIHKIFTYILTAFSISVTAQIFTIPLLTLVFGEISIIAPISNIIFSPLFDLLLMISFLAPLICEIPLFSFIYKILCNAITELAKILASSDAIFVTTDYAVFYVALSFFFAYLLYLLYARKTAKAVVKRLFCAFGLLILTLMICAFFNSKNSFTYIQDENHSQNEFLFIQKGRECTVIDISNEDQRASKAMISNAQKMNISVISNYVISNYEKNFEKGLIYAISNIKIKRIYFPYPKNENEAKLLESIFAVLKKRNIEYEVYSLNTVFEVGELKCYHYLKSRMREDQYVFAIKSDEKEIYYVSSQIATHANIPINENPYLLILGSHDGIHSNIISFKVPTDTKNFIISSKYFSYKKDFLSEASSDIKIFVKKKLEIPLD